MPYDGGPRERDRDERDRDEGGRYGNNDGYESRRQRSVTPVSDSDLESMGLSPRPGWSGSSINEEAVRQLYNTFELFISEFITSEQSPRVEQTRIGRGVNLIFKTTVIEGEKNKNIIEIRSSSNNHEYFHLTLLHDDTVTGLHFTINNCGYKIYISKSDFLKHAKYGDSFNNKVLFKLFNTLLRYFENETHLAGGYLPQFISKFINKVYEQANKGGISQGEAKKDITKALEYLKEKAKNFQSHTEDMSDHNFNSWRGPAVNINIDNGQHGGSTKTVMYLVKIDKLKQKNKLLKKDKIKNKNKIEKNNKLIDQLKAKIKKEKAKAKAKAKKEKAKAKAKKEKAKAKAKAKKEKAKAKAKKEKAKAKAKKEKAKTKAKKAKTKKVTCKKSTCSKKNKK